MRVRLAVVVLVSALLGATAASAASRPSHSGHPPRNLHLVGDHWTAWNPPDPQPGVETYTIAKGDTLWDLAKRFYGNPYLWPQLWEKNQYILDAHWIYPGDPLVTGIKVAPVDNLAQAGGGAATVTGAPGAELPIPPPAVPGVESAAHATAGPQPLGAETDIYCSGYVGEPGEQFLYAIAGSEYDNLVPKIGFGQSPLNEITGPATARVDLATGDIVYLTGGSLQGLSPGMLFSVVGPEQPVVHPATREYFGTFYPYHGRVRILSVQDTTAIGEIVLSCDAIQLGDRLRPFEPEPVPLGRQTGERPVNLPVSAAKLDGAPVILFSQNIISLGQDHVVFIDRGSDQNVTPGDTYTIYRMSERGMPPLVMGEVAVLSVRKRASLVKITQSRYPIFLGDRLDPK
jgi:LysM repeat protein